MVIVIFLTCAFAILIGSLSGLCLVAVVYRRWLTFRLGVAGFGLGGIASGAVALSTPLLVGTKAATGFLILILLGCAGGLLSGIAVPILGTKK